MLQAQLIDGLLMFGARRIESSRRLGELGLEPRLLRLEIRLLARGLRVGAFLLLAHRSAKAVGFVLETLPGFELNSWYGMMAPAGTPRPVVARLNAELVKALNMPDVVAWMKQFGLDPAPTTPQEHAAYIKAEIAKWAKIVKAAKIPQE